MILSSGIAGSRCLNKASVALFATVSFSSSFSLYSFSSSSHPYFLSKPEGELDLPWPGPHAQAYDQGMWGTRSASPL